MLLSGAIISLAGINLLQKGIDDSIKPLLLPSILLAIGAGVMVALYTTVDAYGVRQTANPFTFLAWFFFLGGFGFPIVALFRWRQIAEKPPLRALAVRGVTGASIAFFSFGTLMLATRIGKVSEAAALRETSIIFATVIGVALMGEKLTWQKTIVICLIALGAILIEFH